MVLTESGSTCGDGVSDAGLMRHNYIQIAFNQNAISGFAYRGFCFVYSEKRERFVVKQGIGNVYIFSGFRMNCFSFYFIKYAPGKSHDLSLAVANRKHYSMAEPVVIA